MAPSQPHLIVEEGPDKGRTFQVPAGGARIGRSSSNDISLSDPSLSRFHCRVYFKPDGTLWLSDLGSTNATLLNGKVAQEEPLRVGDLIEIGQTRLRVAADRLVQEVLSVPYVDLGLSDATPPEAVRRTPPFRPAIAFLGAFLIVLLLAALFFLLRPDPRQPSRLETPSAASLLPFDLVFEKEEGSTTNLFRYVLVIRDNRMSVQVEDAVGNRRITREKSLAPDVAETLARDLVKMGFFDLASEYLGIAPENRWSLLDITLTHGGRSHRIRVLNRPGPEPLKPILEALETFAEQELGLAALSLPPERLIALARDAWLLGLKCFEERAVRVDNLFQAIRAFQSCLWYLDTIEPKPDFYEEAIAAADRARQALDQEYRDALFEVDKAINQRDWPRAASELRRILIMIPDRSDDRHQQAERRLLDVERRLRRQP